MDSNVTKPVETPKVKTDSGKKGLDTGKKGLDGTKVKQPETPKSGS